MKRLSHRMRMLRVQRIPKKISKAFQVPYNRIHIKCKELREALQAGKKMDAL
jgi:hypothetical protein